jgi:hypothetical protein
MGTDCTGSCKSNYHRITTTTALITECTDTVENILFLVFLEGISAKKLPLIVLELIQSQTFIEYPNDEYGDTVFREKLKEVLL